MYFIVMQLVQFVDFKNMECKKMHGMNNKKFIDNISFVSLCEFTKRTHSLITNKNIRNIGPYGSVGLRSLLDELQNKTSSETAKL
jgi:hypothetical protein